MEVIRVNHPLAALQKQDPETYDRLKRTLKAARALAIEHALRRREHWQVIDLIRYRVAIRAKRAWHGPNLEAMLTGRPAPTAADVEALAKMLGFRHWTLDHFPRDQVLIREASYAQAKRRLAPATA